MNEKLPAILLTLARVPRASITLSHDTPPIFSTGANVTSLPPSITPAMQFEQADPGYYAHFFFIKPDITR